MHLAGQKDSAEFWPDSFSAKSPPIECTPDCSFDPEDLTIVTRLLDVSWRYEDHGVTSDMKIMKASKEFWRKGLNKTIKAV